MTGTVIVVRAGAPSPWWRGAATLAVLVATLPGAAAAQTRRADPADRADRIVVRRVDIEGAKAIASSRLRAVMQTKRSSRLPWGRKRDFDRRIFDADLRRLEAFYADRGYPQARVVSFDTTLGRDQRSIDLSITVDEGSPIVVDDVRLEGLIGLDARDVEALRAGLPVKTGLPRDAAQVDAGRAMVARLLQDHGYPLSRVAAEERPSGPGRVTVAFVGLVGEAAVFGPISIEGESSVGERVIRRELAFEPGQTFNVASLQRTQRRLYDLDLFRLVNIEPQGPAVRNGQLPVRVTVTEAKPRQVQFRTGYGTEERARGEAKLRHLNVFGGARTGSLEAKWSALDRGVRSEFRQPYLFRSGMALSLSAQRWFADEPAYQLHTRGGRATLSYQLGQPNAVTGRGSLSSVQAAWIYEREDFAIGTDALADLTVRDQLIALGLDPRTGEGSGLLNALAFDYRRSTTGGVVDAKRGTVLQVHVERGGGWLPGDYDYTEVSLEGRHYVTLGRLGVFASRARAATIDGLGADDRSVPFFKRYFLGGSTSLRGWGRFQVAPLSGSGLPLGGHTVFELSGELRVPVTTKVGVAGFVDAGHVNPNAWASNPRDWRYDVGPGLRYMSPVGPVRVDLAYQLNPIAGLLVNGQPESRRWRVHASIGQAF